MVLLHVRVGGWSWSNNEAVGYVNWAPGEPSDDGTLGEDCVEMYPWSGQWNDIPCTSINGFVCMATQRTYQRLRLHGRTA